MARIRTIKPEFWRDEKIATLKNKLAGFFFIGLWNVADDEGKFPLSPKSLSLELPIFRSKEVVTYLSELTQKGLIIESECSQWGLITNWDHQKIDKPKVPKVKKEEIQWLPLYHSTIAREESPTPRRKDSIVKDSIKYSIVQGEQENLLPTPSDRPPDKTNSVIARYCELWKIRYGGAPPITGKTAGQFKTLVKDLGESRCLDFVEAYFQMADSWFVTKRHDVTTLISNLNAISQFMATGRLYTKREIANLDSAMATDNLLAMVERGEI